MKIWNYVFISVTMMLFLFYFGFDIGFTPISDFVGLTMESGKGITGISSNPSIWSIILTAIGTVAISGSLISTGVFLFSKDLSLAFRAGVVGSILFNFVFTYVNLMQTIINDYDPWAVSIISMVFIPLIVLYFISMMDYVTGGTNA